MAAGAGAVALLSLSFLAVLAAADDATTHLSFYMHDIQSGANPTAVKVIKGPGAVSAPALGMSFGDTTVMDNPLTSSPSSSASALGQMQGFYMLSSQSGAGALTVCANLLLTSGEHNGSTVTVLGRDDTGEAVRELPVVGGTGSFRMATGYVLWNTTGMSGADATVHLDVFLTTGNGTAVDASAPVSPVDGGGGSSSSSSSGGPSKASSSSGPARTGWATACAVAVVVAVVGLMD